jgi:hypothetical protein
MSNQLKIYFQPKRDPILFFEVVSFMHSPNEPKKEINKNVKKIEQNNPLY